MFTIEYVKDLQWMDAEHTFFQCTVKYAEFNEEHPSGINATDPYQHIHTIWIKANAGEYGPIADYVHSGLSEVAVAAEDQPTQSGFQEL